MTINDRIDKTEQMLSFCCVKMEDLEKGEMCGFILKMRSPSCGLYGVGVYNEGMPVGNGSGLFAAALTGHFPLLPVEEEERLSDPEVRANFVERVFSYHSRKCQAFAHYETK